MPGRKHIVTGSYITICFTMQRLFYDNLYNIILASDHDHIISGYVLFQ